MSCGADTSANTLMQNLLAGKDFTVPNVEINSDKLKLPQGINSDMYASILRLNISDLTQGKVGGEGAFDALMTSVRAHLLQEYEKGRITGGEYTKAYAELVTASMEHATQFLLNKDQVYWTAQQSQIQAVTAMIQMESERMRLAALKYEALTSEANYALTKLKLANEDVQYCINKYNLEQLLPGQKLLLDAQVVGQQTNNDKSQYELTNMLPKQTEQLAAQVLQTTAQTGLITQQKTNLTAEALNIPKQGVILDKQADKLSSDIELTDQQIANLAAELPNIAKQGLLITAQTEHQEIGTERVQYEITNLLPKQSEGLELANTGKTIENSTATYNLTTVLPKQALLLDVQHCTGKYTLEHMLPTQKSLLEAQTAGQIAANNKTQYELSNLMPKQVEGLGLENDGKVISNNTATYNLATILPKQADMMDAQKEGQLVQNDQGRYTLKYLLPAQVEKVVAETGGIEANSSIARYNLSMLLPIQLQTNKYTLEQMMPSQKAMLDSQKAMVDAQKEGVDITNETAEYNKSTMLPAQLKLTQEQTETQRAQTLDTRSDGAKVVGYVGKQKDLYSQQIDSYKRDAEIKAAKLVADGWMTQKTIDEAAQTPSSFQQNMVDSVLSRVKQNNGLA